MDTVKFEALTLTLCDGAYYVSDCDKSATSVTIPARVSTIPVNGINDHAFEKCTALTRVTIIERPLDEFEAPEGFEIGYMAFAFCYSLEEIYLPEMVISVHRNAFYECKGLKAVWHNDPYFGPYTFAYCGALEEISPTTCISEGLFSSCTSLSRLPITSSTDEISEDAFESCESLTEIVIPKSVRRIEALAFRGCVNLRRVTFEDPEGWLECNSYIEKDEALDLSDPERNAVWLSRMDFDDGVISWYKK